MANPPAPDRNEILAQIAAILTTLAECHGSPESMLYLAIGADLAHWNTIRHALTGAGLIEVRSHFVTLTPEGEEKAAELTRILANHEPPNP